HDRRGVQRRLSLCRCGCRAHRASDAVPGDRALAAQSSLRSGAMKRFRTAFAKLDLVCAVIAGLALLYMMSITVLDIVGRSLGIFTIGPGVEQTELMMVTLG